MGSLKATLCAGAALTAVACPAAATAYAADGGGVSVTPAAPAPGGEVTLRVADCAEQTAVAVSAAFDSAVELSLTSTDGALVGSGRVRSRAAAGAHAVTVRCGTAERRGTLTVGDRARPPAQAPASPVAPVDAGGGGTAHLAAAPHEDARANGPGTAQAVTGLVLAGVAAVAVALRSARRSRGTD
ncbi:hypothetical protein [Streptomyces fumanus]|uniref:Lipoprotein n=1 Tax=Streptomyces fumanus TaxID=67302 RepID=A0A919A5C8_9ACTN|nr:hypothetical protein [Streptomyces fumanus]GHE86075.1 hypothetical protein GCM10018772_06940 [Streptomyces fumanus]